MIDIARIGKYGSFSTGNYGYMFYGLCVNIKAKTTIEIGCGRGYISAWLVRAMKQTNGMHYSIDIEKNKEALDIFANDNKEWSLDKYSTIYLCGSLYVKWDKPIDFIFIDGLHTYGQVSMEIDKYCRYVRKNGYAAFHDYISIPEVKKACDKHLLRTEWEKILLHDYNNKGWESGVLLCRRK